MAATVCEILNMKSLSAWRWLQLGLCALVAGLSSLHEVTYMEIGPFKNYFKGEHDCHASQKCVQKEIDWFTTGK